MPILTDFLTIFHMVLRLESGAIRIDRPGHPLERVPLNMIRRMLVIGSPMASCNIWRVLAERNIPTVFLPNRGRGEPAFVHSVLGGNVKIRAAQHKAALNPAASRRIAISLLSKKLNGQMQILEDLDNGDERVGECRERIRMLERDLKNAAGRNQLMGCEGAAAAAYFKGLSVILPEKWRFTGRNRRPPKDPVNALLSLSYVIACGEVLKQVQVRGLDPCIGFVHAVKQGRDSFVLDVMEPLRPDIDRFVISLTENDIKTGHFTTGDRDGCRLSKTGRQVYYAAWASLKQDEADGIRPVGMQAGEVIRSVLDFLDFDPDENGGDEPSFS